MEHLGKKNGFFRRLGEHKWIFAAFCIPILVMLAAMAAAGIHPFGSRMLIRSDAIHQYFPFLLELQEKLKTGESLFYSWKLGLGDNFWALCAYYCTSPLNVLMLLVPAQKMLGFYSVLVMLKLGAAGLCCAWFLKKVFGRNDGSLAVFGSMYALCSFAAGYHWNIMWMDTFALLPLVMLGTWALVKEGKFRLYVITLFLSLWCNYLMGLYVCIFVFLSFFTLCWCLKLTWKQFFGRLAKIALCSLLAVAMAAVMLLPAFLSLMQTNRGGAEGISFWKTNATLVQIFGSLGTGMIPTWRTGVANVYTSLPAVLLSVVYFASKRISKRQKLCAGAVLLFLVLSFCFDGLEAVWNMMRKTNMLPMRFSFLFSFVLIVAAYQALPQVLEGERKDVLLMAAAALVLLVLIALGRGVKFAVINAAVLAVYAVGFALLKKGTLPRLVPLALCLVVVAEMAVPWFRGINRLGAEGHDSFPEQKEQIAQLQEKMEEAEHGGFYRYSVLPHEIYNDPVVLGGRGLSLFSSTVSADLMTHLLMTGVAASKGNNRYFYPHLNSPLTSALVGPDYVVYRNLESETNDGYLKPFAQVGTVTAYENMAALSLGFMTHDGMKQKTSREDNPFARQNSMFNAATGLEAPIYTHLELTEEQFDGLSAKEHDPGHYVLTLHDGAKSGTVTYTYEMPRDGLLYAYVYCNDDAEVYTVNGKEYEATKYPHIFYAGSFMQSEEITISWEQAVQRDNVLVYCSVLEQEVFDEGLALLADEQLQVEQFDATTVKGTIDVKQPGYFYTSIPYDKGWTMYVDGKETTITPHQNALIALENLQPGHHTIELHYEPEGFRPGLWISVGAFAVFAAAILADRHWGKKKRG